MFTYPVTYFNWRFFKAKMADHGLPYGICRMLVIFGMLFGFYTFVENDHVNTIATKFQFTTDCMDGDNNTRYHLENWTSSAGACDLNICYNVSLETEQWRVTYSCDPGSVQNPDGDNCQMVSNSTLDFPHCCPTLNCTTGVLPNNTQPVNISACANTQTNDTCEIWKNITNCENSTNSVVEWVYNLTLEACKLTCGYCTP